MIWSKSKLGTPQEERREEGREDALEIHCSSRQDHRGQRLSQHFYYKSDISLGIVYSQHGQKKVCAAPDNALTFPHQEQF